MDNRAEIVRAYRAFLERQPHLGEDFINAAAAVARFNVAAADQFMTYSVPHGVSLLIALSDDKVKEVLFGI